MRSVLKLAVIAILAYILLPVIIAGIVALLLIVALGISGPLLWLVFPLIVLWLAPVIRGALLSLFFGKG
jgi:hypothetical protein